MIRIVWDASLQRYGARKVWRDLLKGDKDGRWAPTKVARCTVERLMRASGMRGVSRGGLKVFTTVSDEDQEKPIDLVEREFVASAPDRLWVADLTFVKTLAGFVYVAFIIDAFAMRIVGWQVSSKMDTRLVLDALQQAMSEREVGSNLVHHSDRGSQGEFNRSSQHLACGGVGWVNQGSRWVKFLLERAGSGRQIGRYAHRCGHLDGRSHRVRFSAISGD